jgi:SAM-dependent methyltransferase
MADFDFDQVFGEDYLHFYAGMLTDERSRQETDLIVRLLGLRPGSRVLDIPCGFGRIANRLAELGCEVTGVDSSAAFLDVARSAGGRVEYHQADMREYVPEGRYDAVVNWFSSFGYFDDAADRALLATWCRALAPGGKLVLEHQNRQRVLGLILNGGGTSTYVHERGDDLLADRTTFDPLTGRMHTERISVRGDRVRRYRFSLRTFAFTELREWLLDAGFTGVEGYGAEGEPLSLGSRRMVVVASV